MSNSQQFMQSAIDLAKEGIYSCKPNPRVGCVIVKDNKIIGQGFHYKTGEDHAEINAIKNANDETKGATAYISLEPCTHKGKTPPCVEALIAAEIKEVFFAMVDPNPKVSGQSIKILEEAGIKVSYGLLEQEARELNIGFCHRMSSNRPYIRTKIGASIDGRTALKNGKSQWITSEESRQDVQQWRARSCCVLTSASTVLMDDSSLNVRLPDFSDEYQPTRAVLDGQLKTKGSEKIFNLPGESIVYTLVSNEPIGQREDILFVNAKNGHMALDDITTDLANKEFNEVLIEAGPNLNGAFLNQGLIDEIIVYLAPSVLGNSSRGMFELPMLNELSESFRFYMESIDQIGTDLRIVLRK